MPVHTRSVLHTKILSSYLASLVTRDRLQRHMSDIVVFSRTPTRRYCGHVLSRPVRPISWQAGSSTM